MKLVIVGSLAALALGQGSLEPKHLMAPPMNGGRTVAISALSIERGSPYPSLISLKGQVVVKTPVCLPVGLERALVCDGEMILRADQATFHEDTGEIEAQGHVVVTPLRHVK